MVSADRERSVRDLMVRGCHTFRDLEHAGERIATNILADRLRRLCRAGIVQAERDPVDGRQKHYRLTEKGIDLAPVMSELLIWGAKREQAGAPPKINSEFGEKPRWGAQRDTVSVEGARPQAAVSVVKWPPK